MNTLPLVWHRDGVCSRVLTGSAQYLLWIPDSRLSATLPGGRQDAVAEEAWAEPELEF